MPEVIITLRSLIPTPQSKRFFAEYRQVTGPPRYTMFLGRAFARSWYLESRLTGCCYSRIKLVYYYLCVSAKSDLSAEGIVARFKNISVVPAVKIP